MSYWFGCRVFDHEIDHAPGVGTLEGPFDSYNSAKDAKIGIQGNDMQKTDIYMAPSMVEAKEVLENEAWVIQS